LREARRPSWRRLRLHPRSSARLPSNLSFAGLFQPQERSFEVFRIKNSTCRAASARLLERGPRCREARICTRLERALAPQPLHRKVRESRSDFGDGGGSRTRTYEGLASGFTVRPLCRSGHSPIVPRARRGRVRPMKRHMRPLPLSVNLKLPRRLRGGSWTRARVQNCVAIGSSRARGAQLDDQLDESRAGAADDSWASSASENSRERVRNRRPVPLSRENIPPWPGTTSMTSCVCFQ
jgi:hypothetical protein